MRTATRRLKATRSQVHDVDLAPFSLSVRSAVLVVFAEPGPRRPSSYHLDKAQETLAH